jgi:hypothetical protein
MVTLWVLVHPRRFCLRTESVYNVYKLPPKTLGFSPRSQCRTSCRFTQCRSGPVRSGQVRSDQVRLGQIRSGNRLGEVYSYSSACGGRLTYGVGSFSPCFRGPKSRCPYGKKKQREEEEGGGGRGQSFFCCLCIAKMID